MVSTDATALRSRFFEETVKDGKIRLKPDYFREYCGGLKLVHRKDSILTPYSIIWNVSTGGDVIPDHNDIYERPVRDFLRQLYWDLSNAPRPAISQ